MSNPEKYTVIAESNGHHWIKAFNLTCCRDCGIVRRSDDKNKPCKGMVKITLRSVPLKRCPHGVPDWEVCGVCCGYR